MQNYNDEQILNISQAFNKMGIHYWFDSGTLLGLIRDKKLINNDNDIDIGTWTENENKIISELESHFLDSYSIKKYFYKNKLFTIKLIPINNPNFRKVDICFFINYQGHAWCFQSLFFEKKNKFIYYTRAAIEYIFTAKYIKKKKSLFYGKAPLSFLRRPGFWKVPIQHFQETDITIYKNSPIKIPSNCEKYLSLRYGSWKIPQSDWNFMTDDGL